MYLSPVIERVRVNTDVQFTDPQHHIVIAILTEALV
jgi:hypothetical protein